MANLRGPVFVSYRRNRLEETNSLVCALHDRGVPTWRDVDDLSSEPTEATIRSVLMDKTTSGAILWLTPDVKDSPIIRDVEVPEAIRRFRRDNNFWLILVLADQLDYAEVTTLFASTLGIEDLSTWNLTKVSAPWAMASEISQIATTALKLRVKSFSGEVPPPSVANVAVYAKGTASFGTGDILSVDWTRHFKGGPPLASAWTAMADSARDVSTSIKQLIAAEIPLTLSGTPSIPAAMLLGSGYSRRDGRNPTWLQRQPDGESLTAWKMTCASDSSIANERGWKASPLVYRSPSATALAVCINISDTVSEAFARSLSIPVWRAVLEIGSPVGRNTRALPLTPEEVASLVHLTVDAIRATRTEIAGINSIHFFIAGPAGFAFLLGTSVATLPPIFAYEYDTIAGLYTPGASFSS